MNYVSILMLNFFGKNKTTTDSKNNDLLIINPFTFCELHLKSKELMKVGVLPSKIRLSDFIL